MFVKARVLLTFSQLLTLLLCTVSAQNRSEDSLKLVAFLEANSQSNLSWDISQPLNMWEGVSLNNEGRVEELSLEFQSLNSIPAEIGALGALKNLRLRYNKITTIAPQIGALKQLEVLNLSSNKLESVPAEIGDLESLTELNLNNNSLCAIPATVGRLSSLENLYLSGNDQIKILPNEVGNLHQLKKIIITKTSIMTLPETIDGLSNLEYINLENNHIEQIPDEISTVVPKSFDGKFVYVNLGANFLDRSRLTIPVIEWLDRYAGDWEGSQQAVSIIGSTTDVAKSGVHLELQGRKMSIDGVSSQARVELYGLNGQKLLSKVSSTREFELPVSSGVFIVSIVDKGESFSFKVSM